MKKSLLVSLSSIVFLLIASGIGFPSVSNAQIASNIKCAEGWWADCCKCGNCLSVDPPPAYGYCRHCHLLCPKCRKELGNLDQALEKIRSQNRGLQEAYKAFQSDYGRAQDLLNQAMEKIFGKESDWINMSNVNSSWGRFAVSVGSVITDFGGVHIVDKLVYDILSTEQSSGPKDLANSTSGTLIDILSTDWMMEGLTNELLRNAFKKLHNDVYSSHIPVDQAISNYRRESNFIQNYKKGIQAADLASTVLDLKGFYDATNELTNDCMSVADLKSDIETDQREMSKITNTILKNLALMDCIKETQDSLNHGGIGARRYSGTNESYAVKMILPFLIRSISENSENPFQPGIIATVMSPDRVQTWQIDTLKLRYTINQLKNLKSLLWQMLMKIEDDIWPSLASWMINQWSELKPPVIVQFLKKADAALKDFAGKESSIKNLEKSIRENLEASVTGYEVDHLSDQSGILSSVGYAMGKKMDLANAINAEKWISLPSEKISGEVGRVNMNFPSDVSWSIDVYSAGNKFVTNRSSSGKQKFEDVVPGYYTLKLNTVPVENVAIEKGKEIKLKVGFLNIVSGGHWELRNESKEKFYTSGNKPAKIALPVGIYQLNFDEKYYRIIVRDRVIVRFELQVPFSE